MKTLSLRIAFCISIAFFFPHHLSAWGFFAHQRINQLAVFCLPPAMMVYYKPHLDFIRTHATDPDKLRYVLPDEGYHHYIDLDRYGTYPYTGLPLQWDSAVAKFGEDSLLHNGIVPWYAERTFYRLTQAFRQKDPAQILRLSAYLGHYVADACVPLHANANYNGQFTGQEGIHALWESNIPELLADSSFDYWTGKASYIDDPGKFIWQLVMQSGRAADTVLGTEKLLSRHFTPDRKYAYINRNGVIIRAYSPEYVIAYNKALKGMVERRFRTAIHAVASLWYTAWVNAGQPDLRSLTERPFPADMEEEFKTMDERWHNATPYGRIHE